MKRFLTPMLIASCALQICLADAKEDVKAAAKKLAEAPCYTWVSTTEIDPAGQFSPTPITGKILKDGFAVITTERDGNTTTAVMKGDKGVVKTDSGWKTAEELRAAATGGGGGGGGMRGGMLLRARPAADEAVRLADKAKELKSAEGVVSGDLSEDAAKELLSLGRRPGGNAPEAKNAKASVKYWLKDGQLTKMQVKVSGTITRNNEDRDTARTTTYELKDVGTTKVEVPEEAKKALGT